MEPGNFTNRSTDSSSLCVTGCKAALVAMVMVWARDGNAGVSEGFKGTFYCMQQMQK